MEKKFNNTNNKNNDKFFIKTLFVSFFSILVCIIALSSVTYAWISTSLSSEPNVIMGSRFALTINVVDENGVSVTGDQNDNGIYIYNFTNSGVYTVTLEMSSDTTATKGYCQIIANSTEKYQTEAISKNISYGVEKLTFTIKIVDASTIGFDARLGLSSNVNVHNGTELVIQSVSSTNTDNN